MTWEEYIFVIFIITKEKAFKYFERTKLNNKKNEIEFNTIIFIKLRSFGALVLAIIKNN